jgi:ANTAR domain
MTGKRSRRADPREGAGLTAGSAADESAGAASETSARGGTSGRRAAKRSARLPAEAGMAAVDARPAAGADAAAEEESLDAFVVPDDAVLRRTKDGWRVGSYDLPDLTCAMILADLLAAETGMPDARPGKPPADAGPPSETGRLRATVGQLEHALLTRIRVEQAIGVLAERHRIKPRQAFEQLRDAARSRGRRVIDIAGDVVASATNPLLQLPDELSRPRSGPRRPARQSFGAQ